MDSVLNMLGMGTPKSKKRIPSKHSDTSSNAGTETSSRRESASKPASKAESIVESVITASKKVADIAKKAASAMEEALVKEEANQERLATIARAKKREEDAAWDELTREAEAKKTAAREEARRRGEDPTDEELVEIQRLETERRIAKLQRDHKEEQARSSKKLPDGAVGGHKQTRTDADLETLYALKRSEQHAKATISRGITELSKHTKDRSYLNKYHAKIEDALIKLKEVREALVSQPDITTMEANELRDMFYDYEQKVGRSKDQATMFMTKLDKIEQERKGARKKEPLPKDVPVEPGTPVVPNVPVEPTTPVGDKKPQSILKNPDKKKAASLKEPRKKSKGSQETPPRYPAKPKFDLDEERRQSRGLADQIKRQAQAEADRYRKDMQTKTQDARRTDLVDQWPDTGLAMKKSLENYQATSTPAHFPPPAPVSNLPQHTAPPPGPSYAPGQYPTIPSLHQNSYQSNLSNQYAPIPRDIYQEP